MGLPGWSTVISAGYSVGVTSTIAGSPGQRRHETTTPLTAEQDPLGRELGCCQASIQIFFLPQEEVPKMSSV